MGRKTSHSPDVEEEEDLEEGGASVGTAIEKAKNKVKILFYYLSLLNKTFWIVISPLHF